MKNKLQELKQEILDQLETIKNSELLHELENKYLGRQGELSIILKNIKDLGDDARREVGQLANEVRTEISNKINLAKKSLNKNNVVNNSVDVTLPGEKINRGHLNPLTIIQREMEDLFSSMGFLILDGPEMESDFYNFEALNIPPHHPARDMQDTFYIDKKNKNNEYDIVLRTHTSNAQVRAMQKYGAPLRGIGPGRTYRCEATDVRHEHTFYQLEGLVVDKDINFGHLKYVLELIGKKLYGPETKLRMRPKFYPFVEPGSNMEYTCFLCSGKGCRLCKHSGWLEIGGCGIIHPDVLRAGGIDPEVYTGFAFGLGLNRLAMLKYKIDDIRLFNSGDLRFIEQF